jgi:hypothetical protein
MKKILLFLIAAVGLLFLSDFIYKTYRRHQRVTELTDDRAVLNVYINIAEEDWKEYFELADSTYKNNKEKWSVQCDVSTHSHLYLINNRQNFDLASINCNEPFNFSSQYEVKKEYEDTGRRLRIKLMAKGKAKPIAAKYIYVPWEYGRINHIVVQKDKAFVHCMGAQ